MFRRPLLCLICMFMCVNIADAAPFAYITNAGTGSGVDTVSIIDTSNNSVVKTVPIIHPTTPTDPTHPYGVAVSGAGDRVYVSNQLSKTITVIDSTTADNTVIQTITLPNVPGALAVNPAGSRLYVANEDNASVSVINTATYSIITTVPVGNGPKGIAVNADGTKVYVTNSGDDDVSVIAANDGTNSYANEGIDIGVGSNPFGIAFNPASGKLYVSNFYGNSVSVIDSSNNTVSKTVALGANANPTGIAVSGSNVYVSKAGADAIGIIDTSSDDALLGSPVISTGQMPWGLAVNPANSLLYVANSLDSGDFGTVTAYNTATGALSATVQVGKSPQAFGNFIGPMMYPITQTVTGCGTVSPAAGSDGNFFLKAGGSQTFNINPAAECVTRTVTVDGASQPPSTTSWNFSAVAEPHTLSATFGYPVVSVGKTGLGSGTVTSIAPNAFINCGSYCSADYPVGTTVTLRATPQAPSAFLGWTGGGCSGTGDCTFVLSADTTVTAEFDAPAGGPVKVDDAGLFYQTIAEAYATTSSGTADKIKVKASYTGNEVVNFTNSSKNFATSFTGGWDENHGSQAGRTTIHGLNIQYGTITVDRIDIQ